jgi:hypothetical protein
MNEWKRTDATYQERIDHLRGAAPGGANGRFALTGKTVHDDHASDSLTGGAGLDWFWANVAEVADLQPAEVSSQ